MANYQRFEFKSPSLNCKDASMTVDVLEWDPTRKPRVVWSVNGHEVYRTELCKFFNELKFDAARTAIYGFDHEGKNAETATSIGLTPGFKIVSPEHLAPVFLLWPHWRFNVNLTGDVSRNVGEVPLMDGSAAPFLYGLRRAAGEPEEIVFYDAPVNAEWDLTDRGTDGSTRTYGHVRVSPSETFEVEYVLDRSMARGDAFDLKSSASVSIYAAENLFQIFMARTFITKSELDVVRSRGMLSGVDESCGMLLTNCNGASTSKDFRIANEPAMHKILDLIGDLTFICPALPKVRIEITNGGHVSHRQIMEKLIPYVNAGIFTEV